MNPQPFPGFEHFPTHHCVTGSLRHIYAFTAIPSAKNCCWAWAQAWDSSTGT